MLRTNNPSILLDLGWNYYFTAQNLAGLHFMHAPQMLYPLPRFTSFIIPFCPSGNIVHSIPCYPSASEVSLQRGLKQDTLKGPLYFSSFPSLILWLRAGSDASPPLWAGSRSVSNGTTEGWFPMAMTLVLDPLMSKKVRNPVKAFPLFNAFITPLPHEDLLVSNNTVDLIPQLFPKQAHE